jgi:hypothetical protein
LFAVEGRHCLVSVVTYNPVLPSYFSDDRYFNQLDDPLVLGNNRFILSCGNCNVRISDLELKTVTVIPKILYGIKQVLRREFFRLQVIDSDNLDSLICLNKVVVGSDNSLD